VQSIIRELRGEKIDIVPFSDDVNTFVANSLNPAKVNRVQVVDSENKVLEVVVDDEQLSLAIGKKGQNVRLASRLVGWRIDIKSEQEKKREVEAEMERMARDARELESLEGVTPKMLERLTEAGYRSVELMIEAGVDGLTGIEGIGPKSAERILAAAQETLERRLQQEEEQRLLREQEKAEEEARRSQEAAFLAQAEEETPAPEAADAGETSPAGTGLPDPEAVGTSAPAAEDA
jgi:N utilization substance protein A